jgi:hypothetical protein
MKRKKLHQITFLLAGIYNICWGLWVSIDPNWLFRFAKMELPNYPEIFVCVGMIVGLYGVVYLEIARKPEKGFMLALVGFVGKILGPLGIFYYIYIGKWTFNSAIYLYDSWQFYKADLYERN